MGQPQGHGRRHPMKGSFEEALLAIAYGGDRRQMVSLDELLGPPNGCVVVPPIGGELGNLSLGAIRKN